MFCGESSGCSEVYSRNNTFFKWMIQEVLQVMGRREKVIYFSVESFLEIIL